MREEREESAVCSMREHLVSYLYGELAPEEARDFEAHLKVCSPCARDLQDFRRVREALAEWQIEAIPSRPREIARSRLGDAWRALWRTLPWWGRVAFAGLCVLFVLALFNVQAEWQPGGGFRFRASLLPARSEEGVRPASGTAREREELLALVEGMIREAERRQQQVLAERLRELNERLREEQRETLAEFTRSLDAQQRTYFAALLRELERRRYGALTLADLFFSGNDGN